jgi:hypothetical protein
MKAETTAKGERAGSLTGGLFVGAKIELLAGSLHRHRHDPPNAVHVLRSGKRSRVPEDGGMQHRLKKVTKRHQDRCHSRVNVDKRRCIDAVHKVHECSCCNSVAILATSTSVYIRDTRV